MLWACASVAPAQASGRVETVPGMPPVPDPANLYSETGAVSYTHLTLPTKA